MDLRKQLEKAGIDLSQWGVGQAKTLAHLQAEIESGETTLVTDENGTLLRRVSVCGIDVRGVSPDGRVYRLKEDRQVFRDGRVRRRDLGQAVSEKMGPGEDPMVAATRGIKEELGLEGDIDMRATGTHEQTLLSPSYPGLPSCYTSYAFEAMLHGAQFRPEGYVEEQDDKSTYFIWEEVA